MRRDLVRIIAVLVVASSVASLCYAYRYSIWYPTSPTRSRPLTVALLDEVSAYIPDPAFTDQVMATLSSAGYKVDFYPPSSITIQLLENLPSMGYGIVIFRNHSTGFGQDSISIVTSETYSPDKYVFEQLTGQVADVNLGIASKDFFAITPLFVREAMNGFFPGSIVLMMGCTGLANSEMAQAFVSRGAQVYVSWDKVVQAYRTDTATSIFWQWMTGGHSLKDSTAAATRQAAPDPIYQSQLLFYPANEGSMVLLRNS